MMSNLVELYYYMDEPGTVPEEPVLLTLANGDVVEAAPPVWGLDIKCGKGTDFSYGPWADRQRDHLFRFFFPPDWQTMLVTQPPQPGEKREYQSFDLSLSTLNEATIDVLFSKNKVSLRGCTINRMAIPMPILNVFTRSLSLSLFVL